MYWPLFLLLSLPLALLAWKLLGFAALPGWLRLTCALVMGGGAAMVLCWGLLWLSILLFQIRDQVGW